jgi:hypothetical protein
MIPQQQTRYIGFDVHRANIAEAIAEEESAPNGSAILDKPGGWPSLPA